MTTFSPLRAVLYWPNRETPPGSEGYLEEDAVHQMVQFGMSHYIYKPLGVQPEPSPDSPKYILDAIHTYKMVVMNQYKDIRELKQLITSKHIIDNSKNNNPETRSRPSKPNSITAFYSRIIENLASHKAGESSDHVIAAETFEQINPLEEVNMSELRYSTKSQKALHILTYKFMMENAMGTYRLLRRFMRMAVEQSQQHRNIYTCQFIHLVAKACRASTSVRLFPYARRASLIRDLVSEGGEVALRKLFLEDAMILVCPWCYKLVNVATKKKLAAGGAHKSHIFTSEYTNETLYCMEKNNRGIIQFPLLSRHPVTGEYYTNEVVWRQNKTCIYRIYLEPLPRGVKMIVLDARTGDFVVQPLEIILGDTCAPCLPLRNSMTGDE